MVAPAMARPGAGGAVAELNPPTYAPSLESMRSAELPSEFRDLEAEENTILEFHPNHCLINTGTFTEVKGAKRILAKELAFTLVEGVFQLSVVDNDERDKRREGSGGYRIGEHFGDAVGVRKRAAQ